MEEANIIICLKEYPKYYREGKNIFHRCRYSNKSAIQNCLLLLCQ